MKIGQELISRYLNKEVDQVEIIYNHFINVARQEIRNEIFSKLKMIGFSKVEVNPNGYVSGSLNVILEN